GTFEWTGNLPAEDDLKISSVLLKDGRVLVVGGTASASAHNAAIYDPNTGQFSSAGAIPLARPTAAPLADGKVLLVGMTSNFLDNLALVYDPATGAFTPAGPGTLPSEALCCLTPDFTAAPLANGNVLV